MCRNEGGVYVRVGAKVRRKRSRDIPTPNMKGAGSVIRALRQEAGLSLEDMGRRLGWDKSRLSKYENDHLGVSAAAIEEIARVLDKPPEVILLRCLQHRYPALRRSHTGSLVAKLIEELRKLPQ